MQTDRLTTATTNSISPPRHRGGCADRSLDWVHGGRADVGEISDVFPPPPRPKLSVRKSHTHVLKRARRDIAIKRAVRAYLCEDTCLGHTGYSTPFAQVKQSLVERIKPACVSRLHFLPNCRIAALRPSVRVRNGEVNLSPVRRQREKTSSKVFDNVIEIAGPSHPRHLASCAHSSRCVKT